MKTFSVPAMATVAAIILPAIASPTGPASIITKRDCTINLSFIDSWTDSGLHRFRHHPSTTKADVDMNVVIDKFWPKAGSSGATKCSAIVNNLQYFDDPQYGWVIDDNEVYGAAGNSAMDCLTHDFMDAWRIDSGCIIQAGSIGV